MLAFMRFLLALYSKFKVRNVIFLLVQLLLQVLDQLLPIFSLCLSQLSLLYFLFDDLMHTSSFSYYSYLKSTAHLIDGRMKRVIL